MTITKPQALSPKILVVGAGPVGMTAAIELKRRGFEPRVIDRASGPAGESRALGVHARTLEILEPSGLAAQLLEQGNQVTRVAFWDKRRRFMQIDFSLTPQRYNFALIIPQSQTEQILLQHLIRLGIEVEWNTELVQLQCDDGGPRCQIGRQPAEVFDYVIGCDGARSTVRQAMDIGFAGTSYDHDWYLADVSFDGRRPLDELCIKTDPEYILAYFPLTSNTGRFVSNNAQLQQLIQMEVELEEVLWQSDFRISHRIVESYQRGPIFLAGDAAHLHSPVGGRGMNLGIEDAATLAWLIENDNTASYTEMRRPLGQSVLRFTDFQTRQLTSRNPVVRLGMRYLAPMFMRSKALQRFAFRRISGADTPSPPWL